MENIRSQCHSVWTYDSVLVNICNIGDNRWPSKKLDFLQLSCGQSLDLASRIAKFVR